MALTEISLIRRIFVLMLAGVLSLLAIVGLTLWLTARVSDHSDEVVRARNTRLLSATLLSLLQDMETGQRGYLLTHDPRYLEPYEHAKPQVDETLGRLEEMIESDPSGPAEARELRETVSAKIAELSETLARANAGDDAGALAIINSDRGRNLMDTIRGQINEIGQRADGRVRDRLDAMQQSTHSLMLVSIFASLLILMVAATAIWTTTRYTRELVQARREVETANASLEARVQERTADLTRANEEIQRFAYIVSHDLRAPLVNIVGFTSEMEAGLGTLQRAFAAKDNEAPDTAALEEAREVTTTDLPEAIGFIRASTTKMDRLINAILKLSREGRRELRSERVDLGPLLATAAASVQHQLDEHGARIELGERFPVIQSDRLALEQVFGNLVDNAVKYLAPGRPGHIRITAEESLSGVVVEVADNGRGIAANDFERIFELFRRAGTQDVAGEGIGLAHVRALVRRLGGDITVDSELGKGSRFRVRLPRYSRHV